MYSLIITYNYMERVLLYNEVVRKRSGTPPLPIQLSSLTVNG